MAQSNNRKRPSISTAISRRGSKIQPQSKRAKLSEETYAEESSLEYESSSVASQLQDESASSPPPSPPRTLRSGRTWKPEPKHSSSRRDTVSSVVVTSVSLPNNNELSPEKLIKLRRRYTTSDAPARVPESRNVGDRQSKLCPKKGVVASSNPVASSKRDKVKESKKPSALLKRAQELEREKVRKASQVSRLQSVSDRLMSQLVRHGNLSRDVQKTCAELLSWQNEFWREFLKKDNPILILSAPQTQDKAGSLRNKRKPAARKHLPVELEVDALELCILGSGGDAPTRWADWTGASPQEKFTSVFLHRGYVEKLFEQMDCPLWQVITNPRPRVQVFEFGYSPAGDTITKTELIFKAGAVMVPMMNGLLEKVKGSGKHTYLRRLLDAQETNPFLRTFLPRFDAPKPEELINLPIDEVIELLERFKFDDNHASKSLETFILSRKRGLEVLECTFDHTKKDDMGEFKEIVAALLAIRKAARKHFRRFIVVVESRSPLLESRDEEFLCGLEIMSIQRACEFAEKGPF